jgi:hypothetical protein
MDLKSGSLSLMVIGTRIAVLVCLGAEYRIWHVGRVGENTARDIRRSQSEFLFTCSGYPADVEETRPVHPLPGRGGRHHAQERDRAEGDGTADRRAATDMYGR